MEVNVKNRKGAGRIQLTVDELDRLRLAAKKFGREKLDRIIAGHSPEYWENYWEAVKRRRVRI
jgi:hypothetical protein